ncbi:MAG TPA: hypothetical protein VGM10_02235 [Actinocrinis sp.]
MRRGSVRALVPLSVVGVVAAAAVIAPRIASAAPDLPPISAQDLLVKALDSKVDAFSGTAALTTNLGLPALPGDVGGASPLSLISGTHTLQVAANGPDEQRIALLGSMAEYDLVHNGDQLWIYDSSTNSVGHAVGDAAGKGAAKHERTPPPDELPLTPQQAAQKFLAAVGPSTKISVDGTKSVAGIAAYTLIITPKQSGSLIGKVEIAIDAQNGAPLQVAAYASGATTPAFELGFTSVSFTAPPASRFDFTPPKGAKVSPLTGGTGSGADQQAANDQPPQVLGQDWLSVVELHGIDLGQLQSSAAQASNKQGGSQGGESGLLNGDASSYLSTVLGSGHKVSGAYGSGTLFSTDFLSVLITDDGRMFVGAVTPSVLEADASAQGTK